MGASSLFSRRAENVNTAVEYCMERGLMGNMKTASKGRSPKPWLITCTIPQSHTTETKPRNYFSSASIIGLKEYQLLGSSMVCVGPSDISWWSFTCLSTSVSITESITSPASSHAHSWHFNWPNTVDRPRSQRVAAALASSSHSWSGLEPYGDVWIPS